MKKQQGPERNLHPASDGWYRWRQNERDWVEFRLIEVEGKECLQVHVNYGLGRAPNELFGIGVDEFLRVLRGGVHED